MVELSLIVIFLGGAAFGAALALCARPLLAPAARLDAPRSEAAGFDRRQPVGLRTFRGEYMPPPEPARTASR